MYQLYMSRRLHYISDFNLKCCLKLGIVSNENIDFIKNIFLLSFDKTKIDEIFNYFKLEV